MPTISELKRPDLAYIACSICGEAVQDPEPPDFPSRPADETFPDVSYLEAVDQHARFLAGDPELEGAARDGLVTRWESVIRDREVQAATYRLSDAAVAWSRGHADTHPLEEHLAHAHGNQIPLACERCGHQEQATAEGVAHLQAHECPARGGRCSTCTGFVEGAKLKPGQHLPAYP